MKNTSVPANTTLEVMSIPNQIISKGARAIREMLFSATRKGSMILNTTSQRASSTPAAIPVSAPSKKPRTISAALM
jgi:hypothetical protein